MAKARRFTRLAVAAEACIVILTIAGVSTDAQAATTGSECAALTKGQVSKILGAAGIVTAIGSRGDCIYSIGDKAQLISTIAADEAREQQIITTMATVQHAGTKHSISVGGSRGYWRSVTTSVGYGADVFLIRSRDIVGSSSLRNHSLPSESPRGGKDC